MFAKEEKLKFKNYEELLNSDEIHQKLMDCLSNIEGVENYERIFDITIEVNDFTIENKLLNVSLKINRSVADEFYKEKIEELKKKLDSQNVEILQNVLKNVFSKNIVKFKMVFFIDQFIFLE